MKILNDTHIGFKRKLGTTPASQEALRKALLTAFEECLYNQSDDHVFIAGDLFDDFEVDPRDWIDAYLLLQDVIVRGSRLTLMVGNHDDSAKAERKSSFEMLGVVLTEQFGDEKVRVIRINEYAEIEGGVWALAHCKNQETFNEQLKAMQSIEGMTHLFLHCNVENKFVAQTDHSLNLSLDAAREFTDRGVKIVVAHEHQAKTYLGGKVTVMGNQFPTSIADCLGNSEKFMHVLEGGMLTKHQTWHYDKNHSYAEIEWDRLVRGQTVDAAFVRIVGEAPAAQASEVISQIAAFRLKSDAFVITNAVKIEGMVEVSELPEQFEVARRFEVMDFIKKNLDAKEFAVVEDLMKELK